jgi:hypothetical protein
MLIRGARGLGDSFYLRAAVKYFLEKGEKDLLVQTKYSIMFQELPVKCINYGEGNPDINCRYASRFGNADTNFLQDTAIIAGLDKDCLKLSSPFRTKRKSINTGGKKLVVIKTPCYNHCGKEHTRPLIPDIKVFQTIIHSFSKQCYFILVGLRNTWKFKLSGISEDYSGLESIPGISYLVDEADIILTQPGYMLPMAESMNTKCLVVFARTGLDSPEHFWRFVTPAKLLTAKTSQAVIDTDNINDILGKFEKTINLIGDRNGE